MRKSSADTLGQRLKLARTKRGLRQEDLAERTGVKQSDISKLERGKSQATAGIARLADALRVDALWLELGTGSEPDWEEDEPTPRNREGAHRVSDLSPIVNIPTIEWNDLMTTKLPSAFALVLRDDAMAPDFRRGGTVRFSTTRRVEPGRIVLVGDEDGNAYVREYRHHRGDHWLAVASNPAYQPLDSESDRITVLAVMTGWDYPPDQD